MSLFGDINLKVNLATFIFAEAIVNGAIFYLAPLIPNMAVQGFVIVVGNAFVAWLITESPKSTPSTTP